MSGRQRRFYRADGTFETVAPEVWARKRAAQKAAAARWGKEVWTNAKGRVAILEPAQVEARARRSARIAAAPRLQGGQLGGWQRPKAETGLKEPEKKAKQKKAKPAPLPPLTVAGEVAARGDFAGLVAQLLDMGKANKIGEPFGLVRWTFESVADPGDPEYGGPIPFRLDKRDGSGWWAHRIFTALREFFRRQLLGLEPEEDNGPERGYASGWSAQEETKVDFGFTSAPARREYMDIVPTVVTLTIETKKRSKPGS